MTQALADAVAKVKAKRPVIEPPGELITLSAKEILERKLDPVDYVVPGIIAVGSALFIAKPKSGKTYLIIDAGYAVATGGKALGSISCDAGDVLLLLLEDNIGRFQRRLKQRVDSSRLPERLQVAFQDGTRRIDTGLLDQIRGWHKSVANPRLVAIDTLTAVRPLGVDNKRNIFQAEYELCRAITDLAHELNIAIIIVHHMRKLSSDDVLDDVSGTLGLNAAVDTIIGLRKTTGGYELKGRGRDVDEFELGLIRGDGRWKAVGSADELRMSGERKAAVDVLRAAGVPMTVGDIAKEMGGKPNTVRKMLERMHNDQDGIEKAERGLYRLIPDYAPDAY
jgi:hypothetical protein